MTDKTLTTKERAELVYKRLNAFLHKEEGADLTEFTMGGISACCVILDIENPYTGNRFTGELEKI